MASMETPETLAASERRVERATSAQWIERLDLFRERFRVGLMEERAFKEVVRVFQFTDDVGHIWMPGATTNQWYRWDWNQWTPNPPPPLLMASNIPVSIAFTWNRELVAPIEMESGPSESEPTPTLTQPPQAEIQPTPVGPASSSPPPVAQRTCPHCGVACFAEARFCPMCGQSLVPPAATPPPLPAQQKPTSLPDLPGRDLPPKPSKPTSLPR